MKNYANSLFQGKKSFDDIKNWFRQYSEKLVQ